MLEVIVCDKIEEFENRYKQIKGKCEVLCLTKNAGLFLMCSQLYEEVRIEFLESKRNGWEYEEQVWDILDEINECISRQMGDLSYIYYANCKLEGITEAAQVLEVLMLQDLFDGLFSGHQEVSLYCCYDIVYAKEIEQLYYWCKKNRQKFVLKYSGNKWEFVKLRLVVLSLFGEKAVDLMMRFNAFMKRKAKISSLKTQLKTWDNQEKEEIDTELGLLKQSARAKDYNWTKPFLDGLGEENIKFRFICIGEGVKKKWENFGYEADNIQRSLQIDTLNRALATYRRNKKIIWDSLKVFLENHEELGNISQLKGIMRRHLEYDVLDCVINDAAANDFFKTHKYKVINLQTSINAPFSRVCAFNAKKYDKLVKIKGTVAFPFTRGFSAYAPYDYLIDWRFMLKDTRIRESKIKKNEDQICYVVKNTLYTNDFVNKSFVPDLLHEELRVIWAPSYPTMWQASYSSFLKTGLTLIDFFSENKGMLSMKFHPNQSKTETVIFEKKAERKNNIVIEPFEKNIRNILEEVDILITNCSLSTIDAVVERKAVISVVCEREYKLIEQHKEGICIIRDSHELTELLGKLSEDKEYRKQWIAERVKVQEMYFAQLIADKTEGRKTIEIIKQELSAGKAI